MAIDTGAVSDSDRLHQQYLDERRALIEAEREQSRLYDRSALTIASGGLGLSFAVMGNLIQGHQTPILTCFLWVGWFALVLSILVTLTSFRASVRAYRTYQEEFDRQYSEDSASHTPASPWINLVEPLNWISFACLAIGLFSLTAFAAANLTREERDMTKPNLEILHKGSTPPRPPQAKPNGGSTPPAPPAKAPAVTPPPPPPPKQ